MLLLLDGEIELHIVLKRPVGAGEALAWIERLVSEHKVTTVETPAGLVLVNWHAVRTFEVVAVDPPQ